MAIYAATKLPNSSDSVPTGKTPLAGNLWAKAYELEPSSEIEGHSYCCAAEVVSY
jgi:hypothetical protein